MKKILDEYKDIIIYTICGILIILSSYTIIININHARFINRSVYVSEMDSQLKTFKNNIVAIEKEVNSKENSNLKRILYLLKNDGLYKVIPGDKLKYEDLYFLNNYFIDTIINDGYISNMKVYMEFDGVYEEFVHNLILNSNYVNREMENNSNYQYDVLNNDIRDTINEQYQLILNNYLNFSNIVLEMCGSV